MNKLLIATILLAGSQAAFAADGGTAQQELWQRQVRQTECRFAASMAGRDLATFESFLAEPTLFFTGDGPLRGKAAVVAAWRRFYVDGDKPPFSWEPDQVTAVADGSLAYSTGPVFNPQGLMIGRFASVWRQEAPGRWRIIIDRGVPLTEAERAKPPTPGKGCDGQ